MKIIKESYLVIIPFLTALLSAETFQAEISTAIEVSFESEPGFSYELYSGTDLSNLTATGRRLTGTGIDDHFLIRKPGSSEFFYVSRSESPMVGFIQDAATIDFKNSTSVLNGGNLSLFNVRADSPIFDLDDYLIIDYLFDPVAQQFVPESIERYEDLGPAAFFLDSFFPVGESEGNMSIQSGESTLNNDTRYTIAIPEGGTSIELALGARDVVGYMIDVDDPFRFEIVDSLGEIINSGSRLNRGFRTTGQIARLRNENITFRFFRIEDSNTSVRITFTNSNNRGDPSQLISLNESFSVSTGEIGSEYRKRIISLEEGAKILIDGRFTGGGGIFSLTDEQGYEVGGYSFTGSSSGIFDLSSNIESSGDYILIFYGRAFESNGFNGVVTSE